MKHKIVGGVTTKDEDWIIEKTLSVLDKFCDNIIVYDDGSTDKTEEIARSFDKVDWKVRPPHNPLDREEGKQRQELIEFLKPKEPDYVLLLDADEIPTPGIIPFLDNMDDSITWRIRMINLWGDESKYRCDHPFNPFDKIYWGKYPLLKFNANQEYTYNLRTQKGSCSPYHPAPINLMGKISETDDFHIIHYGMISESFTSGDKFKFYAMVEERNGKGSYEDMLRLHNRALNFDKVQTKEVNSEWFWK